MFPKGASPYGVLDMAGNVSEWVSDGFEFDKGYGELPTVNPVTPADGELRGHRGGPWQGANLGAGGYTFRTSMRWSGGIADNETLNRALRCARDP
jgi:formylglycine-generating enzyme required for sulfatase activity